MFGVQTAGVVREALLTMSLRGGAGGAGGAGRTLLCAWGAALTTAGPALALPPLTELLRAFGSANTQYKKVLERRWHVTNLLSNKSYEFCYSRPSPHL